MFQRILVPLDGSALAEAVLPHALGISQTFDAQLTFVHVVDEGLATGDRQVDPVTWHLLKAESQNYLQNVGNRWPAVAQPAQAVLLEGSPAERIIAYASENDSDLIMLSSHGRSGPSEWNVSTVVQKIIMRAYRSIMIVRASMQHHEQLLPARYERVLVPLDGSRRAEGILPLVQRLIEAYDRALDVTLVHFVQKPILFRHPPSADDAALVDEIVRRNAEEASDYLGRLCERLGPCARLHVAVSESPSLALLEWAETQTADLILFSAHGQTAGHFPYGSLVTHFINYGQTPLLIYQDLPQDQLRSPLGLQEQEFVPAQRGRLSAEVTE